MCGNVADVSVESIYQYNYHLLISGALQCFEGIKRVF